MPRVLIVDDDPEIVDILREFLTRKGYEVVTAADGPGALRLVKAGRPHVVPLDIRLPKMNGLEALRQIRVIDREVGVSMITAIDEEGTGRQALKLGVSDSLVMPLDLDYLDRSLWYTVTGMNL